MPQGQIQSLSQSYGQGQTQSHNPSQSQFQSQNQNQIGQNSYYSASATAAAADLPPPPHRPRMRRVESSSSEDSISLHISKARSPTQQYNPQFSQPPAPAFATAHPNSSSTSLQNFSRPTPSPLTSAASLAARSVAASHEPQQQQQQQPPQQQQQRSASYMNQPASRSAGHSRKHSQSAGVFEPTLPSISTSNLSTHVNMSQQSPVQRDLPASHIAAQAAVLSHQQSNSQQLQHMQQHSRQRSQTAPMIPSDQPQENASPVKRTSGPLNPPVLSLTEASAPRDTGFGSQGYHNGLLGSNAAATAANAAFPRSGQTSPIAQIPPQPQPPPPPPPPLPEKKPEKSSKMKLFSKPSKIGTKGETKDKPLPSPSKIGSALSALQRGNFSTTSLDTTAASFYNMNNSSAATIRPGDLTQPAEKEKEKKHHFLSRQRHKTKDKDDYHSQLSSAASNSRPTDPSAPTSLYNFKLPSSPGPNSSTFKNISGLGHGGRARKKESDKSADLHAHDSVGSVPDFGPGSLGSINTPLYLEPLDSAKYGLNSMSMDDAFPYLKSKLLVIFEGEDLRLPVEDFNRVVTLHLQYCIKIRSPMQVVDDLRDLLWTGFSSLDHNLRKHSEERLIPNLVDLWMHVFTGVLPYMQAVFLPLDLEFAGVGSLLTPEQARDFWGGVVAGGGAPPDQPGGGDGRHGSVSLAPASAVLDVRRLVLTAYRDVVILPRYEKLKTIFSRLSLEFFPGMSLASPLPDIPGSAGGNMSASPGTDSVNGGGGGFPFGLTSQQQQQQRPGTAMSLDPSTASYNSTSTTLLGDMVAGAAGGAVAQQGAAGMSAGANAGAGTRSRGLSNVSFASSSGAHSTGTADSLSLSLRPPKLTPGGSSSVQGSSSSLAPHQLQQLGGGGGGSLSVLGLSLMREQNVEDSKYVTDMVGRMLQCMSVLAGATGRGVGMGAGGGTSGAGGGEWVDEGTRMVEELGRLLKLNWLGRGRTGRNRRGIVGGRVARREAMGAGGGGGGLGSRGLEEIVVS